MFPFVNYCILENSTAVASKCLFTQNFWYSVIQLINGKEPTNSTKFPNRLLSSFHKINIKHSSILRPIELRLEHLPLLITKGEAIKPEVARRRAKTSVASWKRLAYSRNTVTGTREMRSSNVICISK
ncbi:hypothetical protein AB4K20DRAFT_1870160 [Rhizopus microsporus]|uniref:Uncharacterized protein n=1 Tax=Rhizopus microsporus TaxID=58291 RepID=A0A1X0S8G1_RHIZD|nr:hypothetical protein BCV71DRAFT_233096 [Rhizopus microsporus]